MSPELVHKLFNKIKQVLPLRYQAIPLYINEYAANINAQYHFPEPGNPERYIMITAGVLKEKPLLIIETLCHELGHYILGHEIHFHNHNYRDEWAADHFALVLMEMAGFNSEACVRQYPSYSIYRFEETPSHGNTKERYDSRAQLFFSRG